MRPPGIVPLEFVAGAVARALTPGDAFSQMSGPASWGLSLVIGAIVITLVASFIVKRVAGKPGA